MQPQLQKKRASRSLRAQVVLIILTALAALLALQSAALLVFLRRNDQNRQVYIEGMVGALDTSLSAMAQSLEAVGSFIGSYPAFQSLYIDRTGSADSYADASNTVRFFLTYVPIVKEVIVVDLGGIATGYYAPQSYDIVDRVGERYALLDPENTDSVFLFWESQDEFAYVVPISGVYSSYSVQNKMATAIVICDAAYIGEMLRGDPGEGGLLLSVINGDGQVVASSGRHPPEDASGVRYAVYNERLGLHIRAWGTGTYRDDVYLLLSCFFIVSTVVILLCMLLILGQLNWRVITPVSRLAGKIAEGKGGQLKRRVPRIGIREIDSIVDCFNQMLDENERTTRQIFLTQDQLYESELRENEAEIYALQSQINPHFLYNTLQCVRSIALMRGVSEIAEIALSLSDLFRYSIQGGELVRLEDELDIVTKYEMVSAIRFQNRFVFCHDIDQSLLHCRMLKMLIQPLIENAVFHGVSKREDGGVVVLRIGCEAGDVLVEVEDNGPQFSQEQIAEILVALQQDFHHKLVDRSNKYLGLYNINRRIQLRYGAAYSLSISRREGITTVSIRFPILKGGS